MDTSNPAAFVNAGLLRQFIGRRVRTVLQVVRSESGSGSVVGKSTDDHQITVSGSPSKPLTAFVEVIGIADSNQSIRADTITNFGDSFGMFPNSGLILLFRSQILVVSACLLHQEDQFELLLLPFSFF